MFFASMFKNKPFLLVCRQVPIHFIYLSLLGICHIYRTLFLTGWATRILHRMLVSFNSVQLICVPLQLHYLHMFFFFLSYLFCKFVTNFIESLGDACFNHGFNEACSSFLNIICYNFSLFFLLWFLFLMIITVTGGI